MAGRLPCSCSTRQSARRDRCRHFAPSMTIAPPRDRSRWSLWTRLQIRRPCQWYWFMAALAPARLYFSLVDRARTCGFDRTVIGDWCAGTGSTWQFCFRNEALRPRASRCRSPRDGSWGADACSGYTVGWPSASTDGSDRSIASISILRSTSLPARWIYLT